MFCFHIENMFAVIRAHAEQLKFSRNKIILYLITLIMLGGEGDGGGEGDDGEKKKRQTRGGKGAVKAKKKAEPQGVKLATAKRGKKKTVTIVQGLASYGMALYLIVIFF